MERDELKEAILRDLNVISVRLCRRRLTMNILAFSYRAKQADPVPVLCLEYRKETCAKNVSMFHGDRRRVHIELPDDVVAEYKKHIEELLKGYN